jgi:hypothetical protein
VGSGAAAAALAAAWAPAALPVPTVVDALGAKSCWSGRSQASHRQSTLWLMYWPPFRVNVVIAESSCRAATAAFGDRMRRPFLREPLVGLAGGQ